ncbi:MAG: response regulator transcription factor [Cyanobacteriota bacterium]
MNQTITILVVEDHDLTRKGVLYGLNKNTKFEIVGEAEDGKEAIEKFKETKPSVVLMDIALPVMNGIDATKKIKELEPATKVIMLTSYNDKEKVFGAFSAGADAYCMKDIKSPTLNKIIEVVFEGGVWLDPHIADLIIKILPYFDRLTPSKKDLLPESISIVLTNREKEILKLISNGLNNKDIAEELSLSVYTVKNHVSNIINKLAVDDRTQAAIMALKKGLI